MIRPVAFVAFLLYAVRSVKRFRLLHLLLEPLDELRKRSAAVGNLVLLCLWHFSVRLAFVLKAGVPALEVSVSDFVSRMGGFKSFLPKSVGPRASTIEPYIDN